MQGVMALALAAQPLQALFRQKLGLTPANMQDLARASEASPEKWSHVRRKRLGARSGPQAKWQDAAAAAAALTPSPVSPSKALVPLASPSSTQLASLIAASAAHGSHTDSRRNITDLEATTTHLSASTNTSLLAAAGNIVCESQKLCNWHLI
ncbi:hypothetical protein WJX74_007813 [Apatococcus lobatus]|uniref:Uncharacterized protein n=1 Tax=Apatococcus lobatus TaxID=904363 RepID=A0AAW1Q952_9CHLO